MKCRTCNNYIIIHNNLFKKENKPLTALDLTTNGMIHSVEGLKYYSNHEMCETCMTHYMLNHDRKKIKSYISRSVRETDL